MSSTDEIFQSAAISGSDLWRQPFTGNQSYYNSSYFLSAHSLTESEIDFLSENGGSVT